MSQSPRVLRVFLVLYLVVGTAGTIALFSRPEPPGPVELVATGVGAAVLLAGLALEAHTLVNVRRALARERPRSEGWSRCVVRGEPFDAIDWRLDLSSWVGVDAEQLRFHRVERGRLATTVLPRSDVVSAQRVESGDGRRWVELAFAPDGSARLRVRLVSWGKDDRDLLDLLEIRKKDLADRDL